MELSQKRHIVIHSVSVERFILVAVNSVVHCPSGRLKNPYSYVIAIRDSE